VDLAKISDVVFESVRPISRRKKNWAKNFWFFVGFVGVDQTRKADAGPVFGAP
jgi:hypothetical protein